MERILSVSIAAYNVEKTLDEALVPFTGERVCDRVDVMIVDDGSKDRTAEIAKDFEKRYPGTFRLISKENGGWGSTLNTGFAEAKGKYFKQLDGDDYYSAENLPTFLDFLEDCDADLVHSPYVTFTDLNGAILNVYGGYEGIYRPFADDAVQKVSDCPQYIPAMHALTVKTSLLHENKIRITEHCFYTDVEFILKSFNCAETIAFFQRPIYCYRLARDGQSMSISGVRKHYKDHLKMLFTMLDYEKRAVSDETKKKIFKRRLCSACNMQYVFFFALKGTRAHKKELLEFDRRLKTEYPSYYAYPQGTIIDCGRKFGFTPRWLFAGAKMRKDKKENANIFEGVS